MARLEEAVKQRLRAGNELVCILDSEISLWRLVYKHFPMAFFVLDIFHVLEHIVDVAHCFYKENSPEAIRFVRETNDAPERRCGQAIGGLKQILIKRKLSKSQKSLINKVIGYLERNKEHLR